MVTPGSGGRRRRRTRKGTSPTSYLDRPRTACRRDARQPPRRAARSHPADLQPLPTPPAPPLHEHASARQAPQRHDRRGRPGAVVLPLGRRDRTLIQQRHRTDSSTPAQEAGTPGRHSGRHARSRYGQHPSSGATLVLRPAHRRQQKQGHGVSEKSPHFRLATPSPSPTSRPPETTRYTVSATSSRRNFSLPP